MSRNLSNREKWLGTIVGVGVLVFGVLMFGDWFFQSRTRLQREIASKGKQLRLMEGLAAEQPFWEQRDAWIREKQPPAGRDDSAGVQLLDEVRKLATKHELVLVNNPTIFPAERQPTGVAVAVELEVKSPWAPLIAFLHELQTPDQFVALDNVNLKVDTEDQTKLRGRLRVARWLAPL